MATFWSHRVGGGRAPLQGPKGPTLPMLGHLDVVEELDLCFGTGTRSLAMTYVVVFSLVVAVSSSCAVFTHQIMCNLLFVVCYLFVVCGLLFAFVVVVLCLFVFGLFVCFVCLFVCSFVRLFVCSFVCLFVCLLLFVGFVCLFVCLCVCLFLCLFACLFFVLF